MLPMKEAVFGLIFARLILDLAGKKDIIIEPMTSGMVLSEQKLPGKFSVHYRCVSEY